uniref:Uncharacterized protein n=1 Tax=Arundo donax TaxID=35708 RepID=A0A0A8XXJ0_ARUDO
MAKDNKALVASSSTVSPSSASLDVVVTKKTLAGSVSFSSMALLKLQIKDLAHHADKCSV